MTHVANARFREASCLCGLTVRCERAADPTDPRPAIFIFTGDCPACGRTLQVSIPRLTPEPIIRKR